MNHTHETLETSSLVVEPLAPDVVKFCTLLARIFNRCLQEQDARILSLLSVPVVPTMQKSEVSHEHAA